MGKTTKELHPSIAQFKEFVKKHPKLVKEVRAERKTWQELYEDWYLFGEEDEAWKQYRDEEAVAEEKSEEKNEEKIDFLTKVFQSLKNMDVNQMQYHIANVNSAIANIQQVIQQFQPNKPPGGSGSGSSAPQHPFGFRKD